MPEPARTRRAVVETMIGTLVLSVIWSSLLNTVLELFNNGADVKRLVGYNLYLHFPIFALSTFVVWLVFLLFLGLIGRLWITCALTLAVALTVGMTNRVKVRLRMEPLYPSDVDFLKSPGFLFSMVTPWQLVFGVGILAVVVAGVIFVGRFPSRTFRPIKRSATPKAWWMVVGLRAAGALTCLQLLAYASSFNANGNKLRLAYEDQGAQWAFWYQKVNYERNGLVPGLLYNLSAEPMDTPAGYSQERMSQLAARWQREADKVNGTRALTTDEVNVVAILSEAFSDPKAIAGAEVSGDPIPYTRELMRRTTSGKMLAQLFGGGTANMEFETLTGQSLSQFKPQVNTPYQQFVHKQESYPTIAGYLQSQGHRAVAIHPYMTAMYQRNEVYRAFGLDAFIHDSTMEQAEKIDDAKFISDESAFQEVTHQIEATERPLFVNLVTMQNHFPMAGGFEDPWPVSGVKESTKDELGAYSRGLHYTDKALRRLIERLEASDEKTVVVCYGDHLPAFWPKDVYDQNGDPAMKSTPFFIWANFETKKLDTAELTSPIHFMPLLFKHIGAKVPPYYVLLSRLYERLPAMEQGVRYDWKGDELEDLDAETQALLDNYRLLQYDLSIGKRYAEEEMFYGSGGEPELNAAAD